MEIKLMKREGTYFSKTKNKDVPYTNFYIKCNDTLVPVEVKYFPNEAFEGRDPGYASRMMLLSTLAEPLPEKVDEPSKATNNV